jgi:uncharacterized protein (DUF1919 family)
MRLWEYFKNLEWVWYKERRRNRLRQRDVTIIASNCVGTIMYHDLGIPFRTPTINLTVSMRDLVKMAGNLRWYMEQELTECALPEDVDWPAGLLRDIQVNFVHYTSFAEAVEQWEERKKRINWDRIVLVGAERDDCGYEVLQSFDRLPWPNKVVFTRKEYPEFPSAFYIRGFEDRPELGLVLDYRPRKLKRRYMDDFDYVAFLNGAAPTGGVQTDGAKRN